MLIKLCYLALILQNILPLFMQIPIPLQLVLSTSCCIYIGSWYSLAKLSPYYPASSNKKQDEEEEDVEENKDVERLTTMDAIKFPFVASSVLFGLYVIYKYVSKYYLNIILSIYFSYVSAIALKHMLIKLFENQTKKRYDNPFKKLPLVGKYVPKYFTQYDVICYAISIPLACLYLYTRHFLLINLFGISLSIVAIEFITLGNFKIATILLSGLFFYDIFWVYGTDVMMIVAKSIDGPVKLMFSKGINPETLAREFSMVGLGDIIIPGIYVSLALRYDQFLKKFETKFPTHYFSSAYLGYVIGISVTFLALYVFDAAQPALLFLVPSCIGCVLICAAIKKDINGLFLYEENEIKPKDHQQ